MTYNVLSGMLNTKQTTVTKISPSATPHVITIQTYVYFGYHGN